MILPRIPEPQRLVVTELDGATPRRSLAPVVACHFIFGGSSSETKSYDQRAAASDEAIVARDSAAVAAPGSIALGRDSRFAESGSVGRDQNIEGGVSIVTSDPATVQAALGLARDLAEQTAAVAKESSAASQFLAGQSVAALSEARQTESTAGASIWRNVIIVLGLAAAGVLAIKFWRR